MEQGIPINPVAILAAVLFHTDDQITVKIKHDDSEEESEISTPMVGIDKEGDNLICTMPINAMMHFMTSPYEFGMRVVNGVAVMTFSKQMAAPLLTSSNGKPLVSGNPIMDKLLAKIGL